VVVVVDVVVVDVDVVVVGAVAVVGGSVVSGSVVVVVVLVEVVAGGLWVLAVVPGTVRSVVGTVVGTVGRVAVVVCAARAVLHPAISSAARTQTAPDERMLCRPANRGWCPVVLTPHERYVLSRPTLRHPAGTRTSANSSRFLFHKARSRSTQ